MHRFIIAAALALAGCTSSSLAPTTPFNREVTVAAGQSVSVVDGVSVHFVGVTGDSRCPGDAICITGGDALVTLRVTSGGDDSKVELHTGNSQPVKTGDLTLELLQLMPYPFSSLPSIKPDDYRATVRVTR
jgi:hypothetical protein